MNGLQEMVFVGEIVLQTKIAIRAAERLDAEKDGFDHVDVWSSIQSILIAAGNVSKILWPTREYRSRGEKLRELLKIEEDNLLSNRSFRNHFEHYDERIEDWFSAHPSAVYTDLAMNPSLYIFSGMPANHHRGYNSFNNTIVFRGETLDLGSVLAALEDLRLRCSRHGLT